MATQQIHGEYQIELATIKDAQIAAAAGIVYSKLSLSNSIVDGDISATAAIGWSKISKVGSSLADLATRSASDLSSGTLPDARMPALTGDVTSSAGGVATVLATVNANVGTFGSATKASVVTVNAKGLVTAASEVTITPAASSITGTLGPTQGGTGISSYTTGDILYASASNVLSKLAATSDGYVLTLASGVPSWAAASGGTVTSISVASANGFAGTSSGGATPSLTLSTTVTGILKGNGTAISAATSGTDYSAGTSGLATGILKSTTLTGTLSIAVAGDFPTLNQNTTGSAATLTTPRTIGGVSFDGSADITVASATGGFTVSGGNLALGTNSLTLTGSIASTGSRVTKGWFADLEVTNAIVASITGSAPTLTTARNINGVAFNGSADITVTAAAGTLTGTTLNSSVVTTSITSTGTLTGGATGAGFTIALSTSTVTGTLGLVRGGLGFDASGIAKGGLLAGTGAGTMGILAASSNGLVLTLDSSQTTGLAWSAAGSGTVTGSGTSGKIAKWSSASALTDSIITESGGSVVISGAGVNISGNLYYKFFESDGGGTPIGFFAGYDSGTAYGVIGASGGATGLAFTAGASFAQVMKLTTSSLTLTSPTLTALNDSALIRTVNGAGTVQVVGIGSIFGWTGAGSTSNAAIGAGGTMSFYTNGSASAALSIATSNQAQFNGNLYVNAHPIVLDSGQRYYYDGGSDTYANESSSDTISFVAGGVSAVTMKGTGVVLDVQRAGASTQMFNFQLSSAGTNYIYGLVQNTGGQLGIGIDTSTGGSAISGGSAYGSFTGSWNATSYHLITNSTARLTINSSGAATFIGNPVDTGRLSVTGQNTSHAASVLRVGIESGGVTQLRAYGPDASTSGTFTFLVSESDGGGTGEAVRIHPSGGVSIGNTTDPGVGALKVNTTAYVGTTLTVGATMIAYTGGGVEIGAAGTYGDPGQFNIYCGRITAYTGVVVNLAAVANSAVGAGGTGNQVLTYSPSSERYKRVHIRDWRPSASQIDRFMALGPIVFDYIRGPAHERDRISRLKTDNILGFSAEEIDASSVPFVLNYDDQSRPDSFREPAMLAWHHTIIRNCRDEIAKLQQRISDLEGKGKDTK